MAMGMRRMLYIQYVLYTGIEVLNLNPAVKKAIILLLYQTPVEILR
jgi:hypothetical protein